MRATFRHLIAVSLLAMTGGEARSDDGAERVVVAAVGPVGQDASEVEASCSRADVACALEALVRRAAGRGAALVVTPEYGLDGYAPEPAPSLGDRPDDDQIAPLATRFGRLSRELGIYLVLALATREDRRLHNSQIAFDPDGRVVGKHHKVELYAGERDRFTPGTGVTAFDTPFGRVGLLICADIYGDPRLHDELSGTRRARILALSTMWTVAKATRWQAAFARDWGLFVVAANSSRGEGRGGGIFDPAGASLALSEDARPNIVVASIPASGE